MKKKITYEEPRFKLIDIWSPSGEYTNHRIPGMIVTDKGTLIIYCEARRAASDWANMDILVQRSADGGETFGEPFLMATGTTELPTQNNPVMVQDRNGRIHFLYCENYGIKGGRIFRRYSDDDGVTWSDKIDITESTLPDFRNVFAFGPGHGIVTPSGTIVIPVWMVPKYAKGPVATHSCAIISTIYSTDNGASWTVGEHLVQTERITSPNETEAAVTSDGRVYLNIRHVGFQRAKAYSATGYSDWKGYEPDFNLIDPQCFGSVASYNCGGKPYSLIFANCRTTVGRNHVTVQISDDDGVSWKYRRLIDADRGGYVETAVDNKNGNIYVLYENRAGETDHLAIFNYEWVMEGNKTV